MSSVEPQPQSQHSHTLYTNIICFFQMLFFGFLGGMLSMYGYGQNISWNLANVSFINGCFLLSVQLAKSEIKQE